MTGAQYRSYPKSFVMRQVAVDARDKNNRVKQFKVLTTILNVSIDGKQIGDLFERRWEGEVDIRSIKCTMQMDILRCKTPEMVHKEIWTHLLAYNLLRTVMSVAASDNGTEPRKVSFKGAKQALTAFAPKIEAARPEDRVTLIDAMITTIAYHRVGMFRGPDPVKRQQWAKRLERFGKSGQTVAQFCRAEGVAPPSFYQWKRKLGGVTKTKSANGRGRRRQSKSTRPDSSAFKPVRVTPSANLSGVTIRLSDGIVIEIGSDLKIIEKVMSQLLDQRASRGGVS